MTDEKAFFVDTPWTWRERFRYALFPVQHCELPTAPAPYADVLVCKTVVRLSVADRLRVLVCGRLTVETRTVCEHVVGNTITASVAYPSLP